VDVDDASARAEVSLAFERYEAALVAHDVDAMNAAFWADARAIRHGPDASQYGYEAIERWRTSAAPVPAGRTLRNTHVTVFGRDVAVVDTEFTYPHTGAVGRQSQTWVRFADGWKIVRAHVSNAVRPS